MTAPLGFRFSAVSAGIRKDGRIDLALAACDEPAVAAGVFTRNLVRAESGKDGSATGGNSSRHAGRCR